MRARWILPLLLAAVAAVLHLLPIVQVMEANTLSARFRLRGPIHRQAKVAVVAIDDFTEGTVWKDIPKAAWPEKIGQLVTTIHHAGSTKIAVDLLVGTDFDNYLTSKGIDETPTTALASAIAETDGRTYLARSSGRELPEILEFDSGAKLVSVTAILRADGVVRGVPRYDQELPSLAMALGGDQKKGVVEINFFGSDPPTYSASDVLAGRVDQEELKDAYVLIGETYSGSEDILRTPFENSSHGVMVHADALQSLLDNKQLTVSSPWTDGILAAVVTIVFACLALRTSLAQYLGIASVGAGGWSFAAFWVFSRHDMAVPVAGPVLVIGLLIPAVVYTFRGLEEYKERVWVRSQWGQFMPESFVRRLEENRSCGRGAWGNLEACLMFIDVVDFSVKSNELPQDVLVERVNIIFAALVAEIESHEGTVLNFLGDGLFAMWESEGESREKAIGDGIAAALGVLKRTEALQADGALDSSWNIRVGLAFGEVTLALVGADHRKQMTLLGATANLAARCEQEGKQLKSNLVLTEDFENSLKAARLVYGRAEFIPKGWSEPVHVLYL